jgi:hypothetical protein
LPRAGDARLVGGVEQGVQELRVDARHLLTLRGAHRLASRRHQLGRHQAVVADAIGGALPVKPDGDLVPPEDRMKKLSRSS